MPHFLMDTKILKEPVTSILGPYFSACCVVFLFSYRCLIFGRYLQKRKEDSLHEGHFYLTVCLPMITVHSASGVI
jgi:hypothetical protein